MLSRWIPWSGYQAYKTKFNAAGEATQLELTQCGLIDRIITNLGLDDKDYNKATPVESSMPLTRDADGDPCIEELLVLGNCCT